MSLCEVPGYSGGAWHGLFLMAIVSSETKDCWATPRRTLPPYLSINFSQDILKMIFFKVGMCAAFLFLSFQSNFSPRREENTVITAPRLHLLYLSIFSDTIFSIFLPMRVQRTTLCLCNSLDCFGFLIGTPQPTHQPNEANPISESLLSTNDGSFRFQILHYQALSLWSLAERFQEVAPAFRFHTSSQCTLISAVSPCTRFFPSAPTWSLPLSVSHPPCPHPKSIPVLWDYYVTTARSARLTREDVLNSAIHARFIF